MRKKVLLLVPVLLLGAGALWFARSYRVRTFPERAFPADTILYVMAADTVDLLESWRTTELGRAIEQSPRREVYRRLGERMAQSVDSVLGADPRPVLREFTGAIAVGILPLASGRRGLGVVAYVSDPGALAKYLEQKVDPGWLRRDPALRKETVVRGSLTYYKYSTQSLPPTFQPCYAFAGRYILFASTAAGMERLLDLQEGKGDALRGSLLFSRARERAPDQDGLFVYLNPQAARGALESDLPARVGRLFPEVWNATGGNALEYLAWSLSVRNGAWEGRGFVAVGPERTGLLGAWMRRAPSKLASPDTVPDQAQFFHAVALPDFEQFGREADSGWARAMLLLQALTRIDFRKELLDALGDECAVFSAAPGPDGDRSVPRTAAVVRLRSPEQFARTLDRLAALGESRGLDRSVETYGDVTITRFHLRFGGFLLNPAYSLQQDWFVAATDVNMLQAAIDTRTRKNTITRSPDYLQVTSAFPQEVNALAYTRVPVLLKGLSQMMSLEAAEPGQEWIREYGLDAEMSYLSEKLSGAASFVRVEPDGISFLSRSSVPPGFLAIPPVAARLPEWIHSPDPDPESFE